MLPSATVQVPSVVKLIVVGVSKPRCNATVGVSQHLRVQINYPNAIHSYLKVNTKPDTTHSDMYYAEIICYVSVLK